MSVRFMSRTIGRSGCRERSGFECRTWPLLPQSLLIPVELHAEDIQLRNAATEIVSAHLLAELDVEGAEAHRYALHGSHRAADVIDLVVFRPVMQPIVLGFDIVVDPVVVGFISLLARGPSGIGIVRPRQP